MADRRATWLRSDYRAGAERFRGGRGALRPRVQRLALDLSVRVGWSRVTSEYGQGGVGVLVFQERRLVLENHLSNEN